MLPTPQSNYLKRIQMIDEDSWVTTGANGVFMRTTNSGANWYFHFYCGETNAALQTTQNYSLNFFDDNTGIVVGDQGFIGRTVNGGVSFDTSGNGLLPTNIRCWSVWFADGNTGYVGAGSQTAFTSRILKTTNGGLNWSLVYTASSAYIVNLGGIDGQNVFAALNNGNSLKTTDGGVNWIETPGDFFTQVFSISFIDANTGFASGTAGAVKRTTNGGVNWESVNTPQTNWTIQQICAVSSTEIYAVGDPGFIYKSTDIGTSWTSLPISVPGPLATFLWYSLAHYGSTFVMSGDYGIVAKSTDGCATWSTNSTNNGSALIYDIQTVGGGKYWTIGRSQSNNSLRHINYSSDAGQTWTAQNIGTTGDFFQICMINETTGYVSGQNSQVYKTTDGGTSWFAKTKPHSTNYQLYSMEFVDENTGWVFVNFATVPGGNVFKTTNGGDNWTQYSTGAASENIYNAKMFDANLGYCVMNQSNKPLYKTTNGGVNWTAITTGLTGSLRGIACPDANTIYICQTSGTSRVAKSTNAGANWTLITLPVNADYTYIDFKDVNTGYVTGNSTQTIGRTTNGGTTWTFENTHNVTNIKVYVTPGDTAWTIGGNGSILRYIGDSPKLVTINLTAIVEGLYDQSIDEMVRRDTLHLHLRNSTSPYSLVDSTKGVLDSATFTGQFIFPNAASGTYYIVADYKNTIETWSKSGGETMIAAVPYNYNFTNAGSQAFGSNQKQMNASPLRFANYSGDENKDGIVDASDLINVYNAQGQSGYLIQDMNGDDFIDASDILITYNNSINVITKITP